MQCAIVHAEKVGELASEFDHMHSVQPALRPYLIEALERGIQREL